MIKAADVANPINSLLQLLLAISPDFNPQGGNEKAALDGVDIDVSTIWTGGRSVEYIAGLPPDYDKMLQTYDAQVAQAAQNSSSAGPTGARRLVAGGFNLLIGLLTLLG